MKLSFGMIFSIILIVIFLSFSFFAITKFIDIMHSTQIATFIKTFQTDVDKVWNEEGSSKNFTYNLPKKIDLVCIGDYGPESVAEGNQGDKYFDELKEEYNTDENLIFYPIGSSKGQPSTKINNIEYDEDNNPLCLKVREGKVKIRLKKDYGKPLVKFEVVA